MQTNIKRGAVTIGKIHYEIPGLGMEVITETAFPHADPDGDNQFSSYEQAEERLHLIYEAHCEAKGTTPTPRAPKPVEIDQEAEYLAREAAREAEMDAYYRTLDEGGAEIAAEKAADERAETTGQVVNDSPDADDDLPF